MPDPPNTTVLLEAALGVYRPNYLCWPHAAAIGHIVLAGGAHWSLGTASLHLPVCCPHLLHPSAKILLACHRNYYNGVSFSLRRSCRASVTLHLMAPMHCSQLLSMTVLPGDARTAYLSCRRRAYSHELHTNQLPCLLMEALSWLVAVVQANHRKYRQLQSTNAILASRCTDHWVFLRDNMMGSAYLYVLFDACGKEAQWIPARWEALGVALAFLATAMLPSRASRRDSALRDNHASKRIVQCNYPVCMSRFDSNHSPRTAQYRLQRSSRCILNITR